LVGGIIPGLAARLHRQYLLNCVSHCIENIENGWNSVDAIALSIKPGLSICLWEGINFTRLLLEKYKKKFIPIHHMESHALTIRLFNKEIQYPYLALLISGGHTLIVLVQDCETYLRFGEAKNLAIGNCIDKVRLTFFRRDFFPIN
jgi:N6-L-threonylcarbamoyladenine synthase